MDLCELDILSIAIIANAWRFSCTSHVSSCVVVFLRSSRISGFFVVSMPVKSHSRKLSKLRAMTALRTPVRRPPLESPIIPILAPPQDSGSSDFAVSSEEQVSDEPSLSHEVLGRESFEDYLCIGGSKHQEVISALLSGKSNSLHRTHVIYQVLSQACVLAKKVDDYGLFRQSPKQTVAWTLISLAAKLARDNVRKMAFRKIAKNAGVSVSRMKSLEAQMLTFLYSAKQRYSMV